MITTTQLKAILNQPGYTTDDEFAAVDPPSPKRRNKYGAIAVTIDGRRFDSKAEAGRYGELELLRDSGLISNLVCQPRYPLVVNGVTVGTYVADFRYVQDGIEVVEDVKSEATITPTYRLKKKLVRALYGIEIQEVKP